MSGHFFGNLPMKARKILEICTNFQEANTILGHNDEKRLGTQLLLWRPWEQSPEEYAKIYLRFYASDIVTYYANGQYGLNADQWHTMATRAMIETFTPFRLKAKKKKWYVADPYCHIQWCSPDIVIRS